MLKKSNEGSAWMKQRTITGIILVLALLPFLVIEALIIPLQVIIGLILIIGVLEMTNMYSKDYKLSTKIYLTLMSLMLYVSIVLNIDAAYILFVILLIFASLLVLQTFNEDFTKENLGNHLVTILYLGLATGAIVSIRLLGIRFVVFLLLITMATDVFAYLFGIKFGRHKMAPNISPKKSWEGALAGTLIAVTVGSLFGIFYGKLFTGDLLNANSINTIIDNIGNRDLSMGLKSVIIVLAALIISICGQIGDLIASKMKRNHSIKDFGNIFPGHGGVMDRFDSAFFASIVFYSILILIQLV